MSLCVAGPVRSRLSIDPVIYPTDWMWVKVSNGTAVVIRCQGDVLVDGHRRVLAVQHVNTHFHTVDF